MDDNIKINKAGKELNESDLMDLIYNDNSEEFQNIKSQSIKATNMKKIKFFKNYVEMDENEENIYKGLKRSNSVELYKKRKKEKNLKNNQDNYDKSNNNNISKIELLPENTQTDKNGKKIKKVSFLRPNFVTIIEVESYKKFNEENTSKDPFDALLNNMSNVNNNSNNNDNNKKETDKEKVVCSCFIF